MIHNFFTNQLLTQQLETAVEEDDLCPLDPDERLLYDWMFDLDTRIPAVAVVIDSDSHTPEPVAVIIRESASRCPSLYIDDVFNIQR